MTTDTKCPDCGGVTTPGEPCPACLLGVGLETMTGEGVGEAATQWTPPTIDELAGRFPELELLELVGRGGMGAVYKARQETLNRLVAIKILPPEIGKKPSFAARFTREAQSMARLNHPNIVTIYDFGERDGLYFFMMEFVDGVNLRQLLDTARVSAREALAIVPQICDALQCAHDQGIVHRDIKPENILMDRQGRVKIADFGLAKLIEPESATVIPPAGPGDEASVHTLAAIGTPAYMAPEQIEHPGDVDHRADIYALGVVFYQMLTGELPGKELEPPSRRGIQIDVRLDEIVLQALEKNPQRRYSQVSVMKTRLEDVRSVAAVPGKAEVLRGLDRRWGIAKLMLAVVGGVTIGQTLFRAIVPHGPLSASHALLSGCAMLVGMGLTFLLVRLYFRKLRQRIANQPIEPQQSSASQRELPVAEQTTAKTIQVALSAVLSLLTAGVMGFFVYLAFFFPKKMSVWAGEARALSVSEQLTCNASSFCSSFGLLLLPLLLLALLAAFVWLLIALRSLARRTRWKLSLGILAAAALLVLAGVKIFGEQNGPTRLQSLAQSPHLLRKLPTQQVIDAGLAEVGENIPWPWQELESRIRDGRLTAEQAAGIMDGFSAWLEKEHPRGYRKPLHWKDHLLSQLKSAGLVGDEHVVRFLSAYHGSPQLNPLPRLRADDRSMNVRCEWVAPWGQDLLEMVLLNDVDSVTIDGQPVSLQGGVIRHGRRSCNLTAELSGLLPGKHLLKCEIVSALIDKEDSVGLGSKAVAADWPVAKRLWKRTCQAEFMVYARDTEVVALLDDPVFDPVASGGLSVAKVAIHSARQGTAGKATIVFDVSKALPLPISFDVSLRLNGETYPCGGLWYVFHEKGVSYSGLECSAAIPGLDPGTRTADIVLTPAPQRIDRRADIERIWGREIIFPKVPLVRHDIIGPNDPVAVPGVERAEAGHDAPPAAPYAGVSGDARASTAPMSPRWITLAILAVFLLAGLPLTVGAIVWIALGAKQGYALGRGASVLALGAPPMAFLFAAAMHIFNVGPEMMVSVVLFTACAEIAAFLMGLLARKTTSGTVAMVISAIVFLVCCAVIA